MTAEDGTDGHFVTDFSGQPIGHIVTAENGADRYYVTDVSGNQSVPL